VLKNRTYIGPGLYIKTHSPEWVLLFIRSLLFKTSQIVINTLQLIVVLSRKDAKTQSQTGKRTLKAADKPQSFAAYQPLYN